MRKLTSFAVLLILFSAMLFTGCDSPTETKATSVTAPTLSEPTDNATSISLTPTFKWSGTADKLEIATNSTFSNPVYSNAVSGTEFTIPSGVLQAGTTYFWRAGKSSGGTMYWCATSYRFTTN